MSTLSESSIGRGNPMAIWGKGEAEVHFMIGGKDVCLTDDREFLKVFKKMIDSLTVDELKIIDSHINKNLIEKNNALLAKLINEKSGQNLDSLV